LNKQELIDAVAAKTEVTKMAARIAVDAFLEAVSTSLAGGKKISLVGFGNFKPAQRSARMGRHPRTGAPMEIAAATQVKFTPGKGLKDAVRDGEMESKAPKSRK